MPVIRDQENIEELRKRLYDRGENSFSFKRKSLTEKEFDVSRGWGKRPEKKVKENDQKPNQLTQKQNPINQGYDLNQTAEMASQTHVKTGDSKIIEREVLDKPIIKNKDRTSIGFYLILVTLIAAVVGIFASLYILFSGTGQISTKNISLEVEAPFSVAGGEKLPLQLVIANENDVDLESVSLVLKYPEGTRSANDDAKDIIEERVSVDTIKAGEVKSVPVEVILFGEENEEKEILARLEYRIANSNSFFQKEATPVFVKLNSSPLVLKIDAVEKISSGQEMDVTLTVSSNSSQPLKNILVKASFPNNFSLIRSQPEVVFGQNAWHFEEISPNKTYEIKIRGLVNGLVGEISDIRFEVGSVRTDNKNELASVLNKTKSSFEIEQSFIDVVVSAGGKRGSEVVLDSGSVTVNIDVKNTLREPIYDMRIEVEPQGNIFSENKLDIKGGFYNASTKSINWENAGVADLKEVGSGKSARVAFSLRDIDRNQYNPSLEVSVKVYAKRISESRSNEEQIGSGIIKVKLPSTVKLNSEVAYKNSPFADSGPIPPVVNKTTTYTLTLEVEAGYNDVEKNILTTSLPSYVDWLDKYNGEGKVEYNPISKQLRWEAGEVLANTKKQLQFQVSVLPTITQVGQPLTILRSQSLTAVDGFTGVELRANKGDIRNTLSSELGFGERNDIVKPE